MPFLPRLPTASDWDKAVKKLTNEFPELEKPITTVRETIAKVTNKKKSTGPPQPPPLPLALRSLARAIRALKRAHLYEDVEMVYDFMSIHFDTDFYTRALKEITTLPEFKSEEADVEYALHYLEKAGVEMVEADEADRSDAGEDASLHFKAVVVELKQRKEKRELEKETREWEELYKDDSALEFMGSKEGSEWMERRLAALEDLQYQKQELDEENRGRRLEREYETFQGQDWG
jgi:hypothetical protein